MNLKLTGGFNAVFFHFLVAIKQPYHGLETPWNAKYSDIIMQISNPHVIIASVCYIHFL